MNQRVEHMGKQMMALVAITAVLSIGAMVTSIGAAADGETYGYTRLALGLLGFAGVVLTLVATDFGKFGITVITCWAAIQSVYYASVPDGNLTRQLLDGLVGVSSSTTVNGEITQFSALGLNLVGLVMLAFAYASRNHPVNWKNRATRGSTV